MKTKNIIPLIIGGGALIGGYLYLKQRKETSGIISSSQSAKQKAEQIAIAKAQQIAKQKKLYITYEGLTNSRQVTLFPVHSSSFDSRIIGNTIIVKGIVKGTEGGAVRAIWGDKEFTDTYISSNLAHFSTKHTYTKAGRYRIILLPFKGHGSGYPAYMSIYVTYYS